MERFIHGKSSQGKTDEAAAAATPRMISFSGAEVKVEL